MSGSTLSAQMTITNTNGRLVAEGMRQIVDGPEETITDCQPKHEFASDCLVEKSVVSEWIKWTVCLAPKSDQPTTTMDLFIKSYELKKSTRVNVITNVLTFDFGLKAWIEFNVLESEYLDTRERLEGLDREAIGQIVIHGARPAKELDYKTVMAKAKRGQKRTQEAVYGKQVNPEPKRDKTECFLHTYSTSTMQAPQNDPQQVNWEANNLLYSMYYAGQTDVQFGNQHETHPSLNEVNDQSAYAFYLMLGEVVKAKKDQVIEPVQTIYTFSTATQTPQSDQQQGTLETETLFGDVYEESKILQQTPQEQEDFINSIFFKCDETNPTTTNESEVYPDLFQDDITFF